MLSHAAKKKKKSIGFSIPGDKIEMCKTFMLRMEKQWLSHKNTFFLIKLQTVLVLFFSQVIFNRKTVVIRM